MSAIATLPGVTAREVTTPRLRTRLLSAGAGAPVLFLHGNLSSATWWEEVMVTLPSGFLALAPDQRGFGGADPAAHIDATRGTGDLADDAVALLDHLGIERAHVVGNSMGGCVVWRLLMDHPGRFITATLVAPGSPYGFGGTRDAAGTPCWPDHAGSGAGLANPAVVERIRARDRSAESSASPRAILRAVILVPPFLAPREDALVAAMLGVHLGDRAYPGDSVPSPRWPYRAPGVWGINNALSPRYAGDLSRLHRGPCEVPILWLRGSHDRVVADRAAGDPGVWGPSGLVPGYPGAELYPPQPMLAQTRAVLDTYAAAGGAYREIVIPGAGHAPFLDQLAAFNAAFHAHIA